MRTPPPCPTGQSEDTGTGTAQPPSGHDLLVPHAATIERLYRRADAHRWRLSMETFVDALGRSVRHRFRAGPIAPRDVEAYLEGLHVADLALACACAEGSGDAWDHFMAAHRPGLLRAGLAIAGSAGRELADSLYGDLYGLTMRGDDRTSLFRYFHGRSALGTWLRAILSQRHVDAMRAARRTEPLADTHIERTPTTRVADEPDRRRFTRLLHEAFEQALDELEAPERLRLAWYYRERLTLDQIGRLLGEHEATVSRKMARARRRLRVSIESHLRTRAGLSDAEVDACIELAGEPWHGDEVETLADAASPGPEIVHRSKTGTTTAASTRGRTS